MKLSGLLDFDISVDLWKIKPDLYIDLRPFPYGVVEQAYAYSFGGEVVVSSLAEIQARKSPVIIVERDIPVQIQVTERIPLDILLEAGVVGK